MQKKYRDLRPKKPNFKIAIEPFMRAFADAQVQRKRLLSSGEVGSALIDLDKDMPFYRFWTGSLIVYESLNKSFAEQFNYRTTSGSCWRLEVPAPYVNAVNIALLIHPGSYALECIGKLIQIKLKSDAHIRTISLPLNGNKMMNVEGDIVFSGLRSSYPVEIATRRRYLGPLALEFDESYQKVCFLADIDCEAFLITITPGSD